MVKLSNGLYDCVDLITEGAQSRVVDHRSICGNSAPSVNLKVWQQVDIKGPNVFYLSGQGEVSRLY